MFVVDVKRYHSRFVLRKFMFEKSFQRMYVQGLELSILYRKSQLS